MKLKVLGRYSGIGLVGFLVDAGTFAAVTGFLSVLPARAIAIFLAVSVSYIGHRYWTFRHAARTDFFEAYIQFLLSNLGTCILNAVVSLGILALLPPGLPAAMLAVATGGIAALVGNYLFARHWVFPASGDRR